MNRFQQALEEKPFLLMVSLPQNDETLARAAMEEGADGLKMHINVYHRASGNRFGPLAEYTDFLQTIRSQFAGPIGIVPGGSMEELNPEEIKQFESLGIDFLSIYGHHLPASLLKIEGVASTFAIDDQFDLNRLEAVKHFSMTALEASIIPGSEYGTRLTFADLLAYRYIVEKAGIPIIVPTQRKIVAEDMKALRETGVRVLLAGAMAIGRTEDEMRRSIHALRNAIDN
ncbi:hypothetical protein ABE237_28180 [Brevibacillus formosus]|uniref:hypothetical protein n=1 Tax=Brevibacillus TaxID=55080 RepID=UPI000D0FD164|nr:MULTISPECIES: hypothetical protein [Brevibacillus]MBG9941842.1 hypothetical protein [Brevibacillus formosus]MED1945546.1 hypothetical protein [Brevibacillus formosus]MED2000821.1 hypothetical protein [Brevibacillus formosus]MED2084333.1 hypothetical protein [Brevibacillus formosus]PSK09704.1 hypothetical protein C7R94_27205 [Brevibacillus sp. NRRL NRS-603]